MNLLRKREVAKTRHAAVFGSVEAKKMATFLEQFMQGLTTEERYFFRILVLDTPIQVLIINNLEFTEYLSSDCRKNIRVTPITRENYVPTEYRVKYYPLLLVFLPNNILGHIFGGVSSPCVSLTHLRAER